MSADLGEVRCEMEDQLRDAQLLTARLSRKDSKDLRALWDQHRPREKWPGVVKAPGKLAVTILARGGP